MPRPRWRFRTSSLYQWRYSLALGVLSLVGMIWIVSSLRGSFALDRREIVLWLFDTQSDLPLPTAIVRPLPGMDEDSLTVTLQYRNQPQTGAASVTLGCQPSLTPLDYSHRTGVAFLGTTFQKGMVLRHFNLTVKDVSSPTIEQHYRGRIVSGTGRECRVRFRICFSRERAFPVDLIVNNLDAIDVLDVYPSPTFSDRSLMILPLNPRDGLIDQCWLHFRNRVHEYRGEYFLFIKAILMGVLASLFATIVYSFLRGREAGRRVGSQPGPDSYWGC